MTRIQINTSSSYEVIIEKGILSDCGKLIREVCSAKTAVLVSETNVFPLYGKQTIDSLEKEGFSVLPFVFSAGEESKNTDTLISLWEFAAENHITRSDLFIALGGGVTGDLTGFAAATFLRGIKYVNIPTTLLSMVDSSVGGKTAVDLKGGKNLAGAFCQPCIVICDPDTLDTLSPYTFSDGMAEVIKYGMIDNPDFLTNLLNKPDICDIIEICVKEKRDIVTVDEKDTGIRQLLNFGHTPAHGIELLSEFTISHGSAVAIGMMIMTKAAVKAGLCENSAVDILNKLLDQYKLPSDFVFDQKSISDAAINDKKRSGSDITLVISQKAGKCILKKIPVEDLYSFISGAWDYE